MVNGIAYTIEVKKDDMSNRIVTVKDDKSTITVNYDKNSNTIQVNENGKTYFKDLSQINSTNSLNNSNLINPNVVDPGDTGNYGPLSYSDSMQPYTEFEEFNYGWVKYRATHLITGQTGYFYSFVRRGSTLTPYILKIPDTSSDINSVVSAVSQMYNSRLLLIGCVGLSGLASVLTAGSVKLSVAIGAALGISAANLPVIGTIYSARESADLALSNLYGF